MNGYAFLLLVVFISLSASVASGLSRESVVSNLKAKYRNGQVFLVWDEADTPDGTTFNVYLHTSKMTSGNLSQAKRVGHHICPHSARDWWQDPASFSKGATPGKPVGFVIEDGGKPLNPASGLFVYTVKKEDGNAVYFAVVAVAPNGDIDRRIVRGENTLTAPVRVKVAPVQAIWQGVGRRYAAGSGKNKPLIVSLHARGGGVTAPSKNEQNYLYFGDDTMGWREGLPFKFLLRMDGTLVKLYPNDRAWTGGRHQTESQDSRNDCPAVNTWWYGYNENFYISANEPKSVIHNYTERMVLALMHWTQNYLNTDRAATYITGGSMGGSGSVAMCLHHPNEFAAAFCEVPMVRFVARPIRTLNRLEAVCGKIDSKIKTDTGERMIDYVDGIWQAENNHADFPYLFLIHGRSDGSIPWQNNPPFYRAMNDAKQGFSTFWNDGEHGTASRMIPDDVKNREAFFGKYRLDASFPVLSNCSDNRNPGSGDPKDGDTVGWINRGLDWKDISDTKSRYSITVIINHPDIRYPVAADVSIRRLQKFAVKPGQRLRVSLSGETPKTIRVDKYGLITIPGVTFRNKNGVRITIEK